MTNRIYDRPEDSFEPGLAKQQADANVKSIGGQLKKLQKLGGKFPSLPNNDPNVEVATTNTVNFELNKIDASQVQELYAHDRQKLLSFLGSVLETLERDKQLVFNMLNKAQNAFDDSGLDAVSSFAYFQLLAKFMENSDSLNREIIKLTKIISDLTLQWEVMDMAREGSEESFESFSERANNIRADNLDLDVVNNDILEDDRG